jgi:hypothetical protein
VRQCATQKDLDALAVQMSKSDETWEPYARERAQREGWDNWRAIPRPSGQARRRRIVHEEATRVPILDDSADASYTSEDAQLEEKGEAEAEKDVVMKERISQLFAEIREKRKLAEASGSPFAKKQDRRRPWTDEETAALIAGVKFYGDGYWKVIKDDNLFSAALHNRDTGAMKDRWRNVAKDLRSFEVKLEEELQRFK